MIEVQNRGAHDTADNGILQGQPALSRMNHLGNHKRELIWLSKSPLTFTTLMYKKIYALVTGTPVIVINGYTYS